MGSRGPRVTPGILSLGYCWRGGRWSWQSGARIRVFEMWALLAGPMSFRRSIYCWSSGQFSEVFLRGDGEMASRWSGRQVAGRASVLVRNAYLGSSLLGSWRMVVPLRVVDGGRGIQGRRGQEACFGILMGSVTGRTGW